MGGSGLGTELSAPEASGTEHFRTDHLLDNIGHRAVSGGFVTIGAQAAKFLLNFVSAAVLARLLSPKDFGLVGMVLGVTALVGVFKELGLSTATVQREAITQQQVANLFWVNVALSGILSLFCVGLAPLLARFYQDPRVAGIMFALSLTFLLTGSTVQHQALLTRQMRFQTLALVDVSSMTIGFAIACGSAWAGFGYWALVAQQLAYAASGLVLMWSLSGWRPTAPKGNSGIRSMLSFGAHLTLADFLAQCASNSDTILVGRFFGAEVLGLYTRANVLLARPLQQVSMPIGSVLIPVLSRLQSDAERYRRTYMRAYDTLALIVFSFTAMCLALSKPLVLVILGPKWTGAIPLFAAFTLIGISGPLGAVCSWIYESQGRGRDQLRNHTAAGAVILVSYLIGLRWGPLGIILSVGIISLFVRLPLVYYLSGRSGPVSTGDLWIGFLSHIPCWGAVFLTTTLVYKMVQHAAPIVQLLICVPVGLGLAAPLMFLFRRPRQSAWFAWTTIKSALLTRMRPATA
jgi:O-antigen/teichoic acid export membrane protein